jgi:DNA-binding NarL/FixJ family response regulator
VRELLDIESDLMVVGEAATVEEAFERLPATAPDVALLDRRLPDGDGIEVCRALRSDHSDVECIILTSHADPDSVHAAALAGAAGLLLKQVRGNAIVDAVRRAARGEPILN